MTRRRARPRPGGLVPITLVAALLIGGCGVAGSATSGAGSTGSWQESADASADSAPAAPASVPDPCTLLTTAEISTATGMPFGDGKPNDTITGDDRGACDWIATGKAFATAQVLLWSTSVGDYETARTGVEEGFGIKVTDISIPGAAHAYAVEGGNIVGMDMGDLYLQVSFTPSSKDDVVDVTTALATTAAGRVS